MEVKGAVSENLDKANRNKEVYEQSKLIMASYSSRELFEQWVMAAFGFTVFFFYEVVVGLNVILAALAYILYLVWDAINDPLIGYLMEKIHMPWEKAKNLKRFPWLIISVVPWLVSYFFIYMVPLEWDPVKNPNYNLPVFMWFLTTLCIYDTTVTIFDINVVSIYPDKFRGLNERRTTTGMGAVFGILGLALSAIIPPLFITTGIRETYRTAAMITVLLGLIFFIFMIPGAWEDKKTRAHYQTRMEIEENQQVEPFFKTIKTVLTNRVFMSKVILLLGFQVAAIMLQTSAFYIVTFILDEEASGVTLILGAMLIGAIISVPIWVLASHRLNNNKKMSIITSIFMIIALIPLIFVVGMFGWIIALFLFGIALGGQWFSDPPTMADVIDDITVKTHKRQQAIYYAYQVFFIKLGQTLIAITFAIVHILTGFVEGASSLEELTARSPTPELALFGIRIHAAIIPAILIFITLIIFWKFYDLTPDKIASNKAKLEELKI